MKKRKFRYQWGACLMFLLYGGLFLLLLWRILYIQTTGEADGHELAVEAAKKYQENETLTADRGRILDTHNNVVAEDILNYRMVAVVKESVTTNPNYPQHVVDPHKTAKVLAKYINLGEEKIYSILTNITEKTYQVEFGTAGANISHGVRNQIMEEKLPGIAFFREQKRYYPNSSFAPYVVGFTLPNSEDNRKVEGKMGIELKYNKILSGKNGAVNYERDSAGYLLPNRKKMVEPAEDGADIQLTLDKTIQNFLEDALTNAYEAYDPESIVAVVANPKTGEILGMSQRPTFNITTRAGLDNWLNLAVEDVIEPGSTMKTFTVAAAIDSGNWAPNATYKSGGYTLFDRTIRDHNDVGWGEISYLQGFQRSSNTAMAYLLNIMGADTFIDYVNKFGFGEKTGIELPGEASGTILTKVPINKLTTAYGQGSTVTPIQLIQAMTSVANDGKMMQPYIVKKISNANTGAVIEENKPTVKATPISADTAKQTRELLASTVTSEYGTAQAFQIDGYDVAGKTGTAQISVENGAGYYEGTNQYLYSFLGMAPVEDPQLVMYVAVKKPKLTGAQSGTTPTSEIFNSVMEKSLKYLNISPENVSEAQFHEIDNYIDRQSDDVQIELENEGLRPIIIGEGGTIASQYPNEGTSLTKDGIVFLKTEGTVTLADFAGWSLRNILVYKTLSQLPIEINGEGYVESQSVSSGTIIMDSFPIVVQLKTPKEQFNSTPVVEDEEDQLPQD